MAENRSEPPDQKYRDRIATDLDCTMLAEAAAGTGKTTCLVARMIGLLREGKCRVETLAAVTFTRKAAAELRTRFQLALEKETKDSIGEKREHLVAALDQVERCFIGTIHSFCARLLRERPVEAGVNPGFVELEEKIDYELRQQAWREQVAAFITSNHEILPDLERLGLKISPSTRRSNSIASELDELGLEPAELGPAFLTFAEFPDVEEWPAQPVPMPDLKPCIASLNDFAVHIGTLMLPADPGNDKLMPKYELVSRMIRRADLNQPAQLMEVLEHFDVLERGKVVQKNWPGKKEQALAELERWNEFASTYAVPLLQKWREHRYEVVMRAIRPARDLYDRLRRERNGLNFQDLLLRSVDLLRDKPDVRRYFRERFSHLLVDEFQDTDPIQAEVMLLLTADSPTETDWQKCRPAPGSLFVVGDPKQSIYRFRRADIVTYSKVRSIIDDAGGAVISLSANFRSISPVVQWVNNCFNKIFPEKADECSPTNRPLEIGRIDGLDQPSAVERLLIPSQIKRVGEVSEYEADVIARTIRQAIEEKRPIPRSKADIARGLPQHMVAGDFMIIARSKARLSLYARKLQEYGLPHSVTGGSVLNDVPELELLSLCLQSLARSDDPIALVGVLRSPLFGVPDTMLYEFRSRGGQFSFRSEIPADLASDCHATFQDAFGRLQTYSGWLHRMPMAAAIERISVDLGLVARACAAEEGNVHAGSLLKAIELLRTLDTPLTTGDFADALWRLVEGVDQHDGAFVRPFAEVPVRLMNLHQCKGLEAPIVFLVDPSGVFEHDVTVYIDRSGDKPKGFLPIYGRKRSEYGPRPLLAHPPGWETLAALEQRFLNAEANRLLYVAATRAGTKLVISQRQDEKAEQKSPWNLLGMHLPSATQFPGPGDVPALPAIPLVFDLEAWKNETARIESRWHVVSQPTYAVQAIKESAIRGGPKPHGAEKAGEEWGQVLHILLEAAMSQPKADLQGLALSALEEEELPLTLVDEVVATVERVLGSDLWQRAMKSPRCLTEVPLSMVVPPSEAVSGLSTVLRGVIDLAFQERDGWVIVDYKSERVGKSDLPSLVDYYRPQIEAYVEVWQKIVGQQVVERGLFFTHTSEYVAV